MSLSSKEELVPQCPLDHTEALTSKRKVDGLTVTIASSEMSHNDAHLWVTAENTLWSKSLVLTASS